MTKQDYIDKKFYIPYLAIPEWLKGKRARNQFRVVLVCVANTSYDMKKAIVRLDESEDLYNGCWSNRQLFVVDIDFLSASKNENEMFAQFGVRLGDIVMMAGNDNFITVTSVTKTRAHGFYFDKNYGKEVASAEHENCLIVSRVS